MQEIFNVLIPLTEQYRNSKSKNIIEMMDIINLIINLYGNGSEPSFDACYELGKKVLRNLIKRIARNRDGNNPIAHDYMICRVMGQVFPRLCTMEKWTMK